VYKHTYQSERVTETVRESEIERDVLDIRVRKTVRQRDRERRERGSWCERQREVVGIQE
jgi:hypothetical protein